MKYTVVLMRPDYMTEDYGQDCYVALVWAKGLYEARSAGQKEAWEADNDDYHGEGEPPGSPGDYFPLVIFEGHQDVKLFGWQV